MELVSVGSDSSFVLAGVIAFIRKAVCEVEAPGLVFVVIDAIWLSAGMSCISAGNVS